MATIAATLLTLPGVETLPEFAQAHLAVLRTARGFGRSFRKKRSRSLM